MTVQPENRRILGLAIGFGLFIWIIDALLDYIIFYKGESFLDLLIFDMPQHELYIRTLIMFLFISFGFISTRYADRIRSLERMEKEAFQRGVVFASKDVRNKMIIVGHALHLLKEGMIPYEEAIGAVEENNRLALGILDTMIEDVTLTLRQEYLSQFGMPKGVSVRAKIESFQSSLRNTYLIDSQGSLSTLIRVSSTRVAWAHYILMSLWVFCFCVRFHE